MVDFARLRSVFSRADPAWLIEILDQAPDHGIDTPNEMASFCAQLAIESAWLTRFEENLNYSAARLMQVWPKRFPTADAAARYAHSPERLANHVYRNRFGNGDEASGDGFRYRGRGCHMLTFRNNYELYGERIGEPLVERPELLLVPKIGVRVALEYWKEKDLDLVDDDDDARAETRLVNGGEIGLNDRQAAMDRLLKVFA